MPNVQQPQSTPIKRSLRSWVLRALRSTAERLTGRSWLWSWLWNREFESLVRDKDAAERKAA